MNHVMFGGLTHEPAARLAQLLVDITPDGLDTVFFTDSGSVSRRGRGRRWRCSTGAASAASASTG